MKISVIKPGRQQRYIKRYRRLRRYYKHKWRQKNKRLIRLGLYDQTDDLLFIIINRRGI